LDVNLITSLTGATKKFTQVPLKGVGQSKAKNVIEKVFVCVKGSEREKERERERESVCVCV